MGFVTIGNFTNPEVFIDKLSIFIIFQHRKKGVWLKKFNGYKKKSGITFPI